MVCGHRFRPVKAADEKQFFLRFGSGKSIINPTKELDSFQKEYSLPSICSSNARHVVETLKGSTGLDASSSAGTVGHVCNKILKYDCKVCK